MAGMATPELPTLGERRKGRGRVKGKDKAPGPHLGSVSLGKDTGRQCWSWGGWQEGVEFLRSKSVILHIQKDRNQIDAC